MISLMEDQDLVEKDPQFSQNYLSLILTASQSQIHLSILDLLVLQVLAVMAPIFTNVQQLPTTVEIEGMGSPVKKQ